MGTDRHHLQEIDEWDQAYRRVESYLQACGVSPRLLLSEWAVDVIERARRRAQDEPSGEHPVTLAMRELFAQMTEGFGRALLVASAHDDHLRARGRLALATSGAAPEWAKLMVEKKAELVELQPCFDARPLQAGPEIRLSKLPPAPIEYAFSDNDDETTAAPWRIPVTALALALSLVGAMGAAWAVSH